MNTRFLCSVWYETQYFGFSYNTKRIILLSSFWPLFLLEKEERIAKEIVNEMTRAFNMMGKLKGNKKNFFKKWLIPKNERL